MSEQRSQHYNWFKGDSAGGNKKSTKDSLKTVWKFTKIFLYFSLFFFSMWGCVQVFVVKTDPTVGRGVELHAGTDKIAPQVTSVHIATDSTNDIYTIQTKPDNIYINSKEDASTLDAIVKQLNLQVTGKQDGGFTLDQANKGGNLAIRLVIDGKEVDGLHKGILNVNGTPIVYTSAADGSHLQGFAFTHQLLTYTVDATTKAIAANPAIDFKAIYDALTPAEKSKLTFNLELVDAIITKAKINVDAVPTTAEAVLNHNNLVGQLYSIMGIDSNSHKFSGNVFGFSSNKYTPIATWGQAWDMHRGAGPFYGIFVYPISWVTNKIVDGFPAMAGWESFLSIVIVVVVISMITFLLSFKGTLQQTKMQELNAKKAVIDAKYAPYKGNKQMEMRQRQEVSDLYKKEGVSPMSSLVTIFVTMPFFFAMWRVIGGIQHLKGTTWLGINFAATSYKELFAGAVQYLPLMVLAAGVQLFSQIYPRLLTKRRDKNRINVHQKAAMKKGNKTQNIMLVVFGFMALIFSAGLQVYFLIRSLWRLAEVQITHHILVRQRKQRISRAA